MKKLRVLLLCAVLALLCWHSCHHVYCSEEISSGPGLPAQDDSRYATQEPGADEKVEEERATHTQSSYDVGLEKERAALKETSLHSQDAPLEEKHKQTVNLEEVLEEPQIQLESALPVLEQQQQQEQQPEPQSTQQSDQQQSAQPPTLAQPQTAPPLSQPQPDPETLQPTATEDQAAHTSAALTPPQTDPHREDPSAPPAEIQKSPKSASPTSVTSSESSSSVVEENAEKQAENQSATLGVQSTETSVDPTATLLPSELDLTELGQTASIPPPTKSQQVMDHEGATDPPVPSKEDIPTFDEWKKKVMEVEEKKSQSMHTSSNGSPHPVKKVQKNFKNNYASVECGAKILSANNEAKSTSAILMENMDLYMLNPCSTKIWFVIELCEPIQVKQLDIANFELFSSTPKDFLVSISDRYPTNKWIKLGTFHARDERTVQSFPLDEQLYAKYVKMFIKYMKVELLSHFGSEHYCPLSLIRVFGTSMVEEYDEIADSQYTSERAEYLDEDYDYPPGYLPSEDKTSKNLLGSATNAILNMVNNIAANVLGGNPELEDGAEMEGNVSTGTENVTQVSTETPLTPEPTPTEQPSTLDILELDPTLVKEDLKVPVPEAPSEPPPEENRIVILIEEEEEATQPTVTLLEEEREEEKRLEEMWERESATYCGHLSTLSCLASLHEHFYCYCSAALALQRQRRDRRHKAQHTHTETDTQTTPQQSLPDTTPTQEPPAPSEKLPETERPSQAQAERISPTETVATLPQSSSGESVVSEQVRPPEMILLEPSRTSTLPPHSFSDTPTQNIPESLPTGEPVDQHPQYLVDIPETRTPVSSYSSTSSLLSPSAASSPLSSTTTEPLSPETDPPKLELPVLTKEQTVQPLPTHTRPAEIPPPTELPVPLPEASDNGRAAGVEDPHHSAVASQLELSEAPLSQQEETVDDILLPHRTAGEFYAEQQHSVEMGHGNGNGNGNQVHGSNQKESVFMRLNNRIKALEMNMSLSSRYLEELSQRYRKQMEEMQRAFNKTIIKLQNTSRIAEEQDQKQTESIQMLQSQLENATKIMLNLSATVAQLQREVSDRQSYLVLSLILCLTLGLLLCMQCCRSSPSHNTSSSIPMSNHYPSPKRCFSSYDDMSLKRRVSCPLVRSKSFQLPTSEVGPDDLYIVEPLRFSPEKKKKRCKTKGGDRVETLRASIPSATGVNGQPRCNGESSSFQFLPSTCNGFVSTSSCASEGSSESSASTLSEESFSSAPSMNGHDPNLCNGEPPPTFPPAKSKMEKRSLKRRKSKNAEQQETPRVGEILQLPVTVMPTLEELMKGKANLGVATFGRTAVMGRV
ncbi:SUN domain-containing ossification factor-like isoform X3 [Sinocyclocheilus rhinocerous]|uniref:SUN domain-containing ossification factor n=1 Tax=Sinocyclocheilus rhinocerous TaxID=307959 RepID=A0A673K4V6_9TELE|nr:PREDICTED: SUN domain-containing ossification factor-like isoform X3 [Sinocyclocheilus rhinocerous]